MPPRTPVQISRRACSRPSSGRVFLQVSKALWDIADEAKQYVHRGCLDVPARFPAGDRVASESQQSGKLALGQTMPFSDGPDLVCGEQIVSGAIGIQGALSQLAGLIHSQDDLVALGAAQMRCARNGNFFPVHGKP